MKAYTNGTTVVIIGKIPQPPTTTAPQPDEPMCGPGWRMCASWGLEELRDADVCKGEEVDGGWST